MRYIWVELFTIHMINLPNLPDSLNKILFTVSLLSSGYFIFLIVVQNQSSHLVSKQYQQKIEQIESLLDKNELKRKRFEFNLQIESEEISQLYDTENPIREKDERLVFEELPNADVNRKKVEDSIRLLWNEYEVLAIEETQLYHKKNRIAKVENDRIGNQLDSELGYFFLLILSFVSFIATMIGWDKELGRNNRKHGEKPVLDYSEFCQSCGRNFSHRLTRGLEKDGHESKLFCQDCYEDGEFTDYLSLETIQAHKTKILNERKSWRDRKRLSRRFANLYRWKTDAFEKTESE